jgi:hypothetical protein
MIISSSVVVIFVSEKLMNYWVHCFLMLNSYTFTIMKREFTLLIVLLVGIIVFGYISYFGNLIMRHSVPSPHTQNADLKTYSNQTYGLKFLYPKEYFLEEKEVVEGVGLRHLQIILTEDTEENRLLREGQSPGREGPVSVTILAYPKLGSSNVFEWVTKSAGNISNYKISKEGTTASTTVSGKEAIRYSWSGLYEGDSIATSNDKNFIIFSVTYMNPSDKIRSDFQKILSTVEID